VFEDMVDPVRNEPIVVRPNQILVASGQRLLLRRILGGAEVLEGDSAVQQTASPALVNDYTVYSSRWMKHLLLKAGLTAAQAKTHLLMGDFKRAFGWREVYPLQTYRANASATDLTPSGPLGMRDIVFATKSRVFGVPFVRDPRFALKARKMS
jgi:hypothetical protein